MRCDNHPFFRENAIGARDLSLMAYWLAYVFKRAPDTFLALTPDELLDQVQETQRMLKHIKGNGDG